MCFKLLVMVLLIKIVAAKIKLDVNIDDNQEVNLSSKGKETQIITDDDIDLFKIGEYNLLTAVERYMGRRPEDVYVRSPTPWGDLFKRYDWEPVKRVLTVKTAKVKNIEREPIVVMTHDSENFSNRTIKVNAGLSRTLENTLTTSWSHEHAMGMNMDVGIAVGGIGISMAFSYTATMGVGEEKSKSQTIGTTSNMEVELKPGQAVTAVLTATAGYLEIEVVHKAYLTGNVAVNYYRPHRGHHFHRLSIESVLNSGGIKNEVTTTETIRINFYSEGKLEVYDKNTGLML